MLLKAITERSEFLNSWKHGDKYNQQLVLEKVKLEVDYVTKYLYRLIFIEI